MKCSSCGFEIFKNDGSCTHCGAGFYTPADTPTRYISSEPPTHFDLSFAPGDAFGERYRIVEEVGRGGMGKVFKARDIELDIYVAIKMIHPELIAKPGTLDRFKKELLLAREISHQNVVRIHDFGEIGGYKFISMQFIDGENLGELIQTSGTLSLQTTINVSRQICKGLQAAHAQGIIHRDLKPQNIMIDKNGKVFITDFGLAKSIEDNRVTLSGTVVGTPQYLSPEQAKGEKMDQRSDIYSLGIIMFEMITGKELFISESMLGYLHKHIQEKPAAPSSINPLIPPFFEKVILRCLEKNADRRYPDVSRVLKDLEEEKSGSGTFFIGVRGKRILKIVVGGVLSVLILLMLFLILERKGHEIDAFSRNNIKSIAILPLINMTGQEREEHWGRVFQSQLIIDLGQFRILSVLPETQINQVIEELGLSGITRFFNSDIERIVKKGDADFLVMGGYSRVGKSYSVNIKIFVAKTGTWRYYGPAKADEEELFFLVDKITAAIKHKFDLPPQLLTDIDEDIGSITTSHQAAYDYYLSAVRLTGNGEYKRSNLELSKAIAIDPGFAMAYRMRSTNYSYMGRHKPARAAIQKAYDLKDKVCERERFLIEARAFEYGVLKGSSREAGETIKKLLKYYPSEEYGKVLLGGIYRNMEEWKLAEDQFLAILERRPLGHVVLNLVYINIARGRYDKAQGLLDKYRSLFDGTSSYQRFSARLSMYLKDHNQAMEWISSACSLEPEKLANISVKGNIFHVQNNLTEAKKCYSRLMESKDPLWQSSGTLWLSRLYLLGGQYDQCRATVNQGMENARILQREADQTKFLLFSSYLHLQAGNPDRSLEDAETALKCSFDICFPQSIHYRAFALNLMGRALVELSDPKEAEKVAEKLKQSVEQSGNLNLLRLYYHLNGIIYVKRGDYNKGIQHLEHALSLTPFQVNELDDRSYYLGDLAAALYLKGDRSNASRRYEQIISLTKGRLRWGNIFALSFYNLGRIYEKTPGAEERALDYYRAFLKLWDTGESTFPPFREKKEDVRKRINRLVRINRLHPEDREEL